MSTQSAKTALLCLMVACITLTIHTFSQYLKNDKFNFYSHFVEIYNDNQFAEKAQTFSMKPYDRLQAVLKSDYFSYLFHLSGNYGNTAPRISSLISTLSDTSGDVGRPHLSKIYKNGLQARTPQSGTVLEVLGNKSQGVFIECGAYDGETGSNSLELELFHGWTGLLIEPNPFYYTQVLGKNRDVQTLNACLSTSEDVTVLEMDIHGCAQRCRMHSERRLHSARVTCIPLSHILYTYNMTHIDYFSLDVEGAEYDVLKTIDFDRFDVTTLSVEYSHDAVGREEIVRFMEEKGYEMIVDLHDKGVERDKYVKDVFFVKREFLMNQGK